MTITPYLFLSPRPLDKNLGWASEPVWTRWWWLYVPCHEESSRPAEVLAENRSTQLHHSQFLSFNTIQCAHLRMLINCEVNVTVIFLNMYWLWDCVKRCFADRTSFICLHKSSVCSIFCSILWGMNIYCAFHFLRKMLLTLCMSVCVPVCLDVSFQAFDPSNWFLRYFVWMLCHWKPITYDVGATLASFNLKPWKGES